MIPLGVLCQRQSGMQKVLELLFNAADGGSIVDSTGRHTPSLSVSGTRGIVSNKLNLAGGGYIRADAENATSSDFDFGSSDYSVELGFTASSSSSYIWTHTDNDSNFGMCLRFMSDTLLTVREAASNVVVVSYAHPSSLIGVPTKVKLERIAGRTALIVNDVEVDATNTVYINTNFGGNGFIIGAFPPSGGLTGAIDDFIVRKS